MAQICIEWICYIYCILIYKKMTSLAASKKLTKEQQCILTKHKDVPKEEHDGNVDEKKQTYEFEGWKKKKDPKVKWLKEHP